ncbi:hypothetical protein V5O48_015433 [Marasmius crinis-equi]|uniref:DUF6697 domain-containing protein n=1 Tax=Marasmius crinis-equi TaxID=585013 RepID=A0ABR3EUJ3_9AGAR
MCDETQIMEWDPQREANVYSNFVKSLNPKLAAKIKKGYKQEEMPLQIIDRFTASTSDFPVKGDEVLDLNFTVTRMFVSHKFGGSCQSSRPRLRKETKDKMIQDGFGEGSLTFMSLEYNPYLPQMPGKAGITFGSWPKEELQWEQEDAGKLKKENRKKVPQTPKDKSGRQAQMQEKEEPVDENKDDGIDRAFVRLATNEWLYLGQYKTSFKGALSKEEWDFELTERVKSTWVDGAMSQRWGLQNRARVFLRNRPGSDRKFTRAEYDELLDKLEDKSEKALGHNVTKAQMRECFDRGEEVITVIVMECVGYDYAFQRKMQREFPAWLEEQIQLNRRAQNRSLEDKDYGGWPDSDLEDDATYRPRVLRTRRL